jgi:hypothetical protein
MRLEVTQAFRPLQNTCTYMHTIIAVILHGDLWLITLVTISTKVEFLWYFQSCSVIQVLLLLEKLVVMNQYVSATKLMNGLIRGGSRIFQRGGAKPLPPHALQ